MRKSKRGGRQSHAGYSSEPESYGGELRRHSSSASRGRDPSPAAAHRLSSRAKGARRVRPHSAPPAPLHHLHLLMSTRARDGRTPAASYPPARLAPAHQWASVGLSHHTHDLLGFVMPAQPRLTASTSSSSSSEALAAGDTYATAAQPPSRHRHKAAPSAPQGGFSPGVASRGRSRYRDSGPPPPRAPDSRSSSSPSPPPLPQTQARSPPYC